MYLGNEIVGMGTIECVRDLRVQKKSFSKSYSPVVRLCAAQILFQPFHQQKQTCLNVMIPPVSESSASPAES